ncbi:hypothetical protein BGW80DRAFT_838010 [Lactifluus volemus]|nr:hypothetical protein BGW80DRAFT_838010 [Lactifluus volemus]
MDNFGFPDDDPFLIPLGPFEPFKPREPTKNNQLAGPPLPSQHPEIRGNEELLPEVLYCSSIHYRVGIVNSPQEYQFRPDPHFVYTFSAVSTAGPLDIEPYPFDNGSLTVSSSVGRNIREDNSGPPTFPTQISATSHHGPMTPQAQQEYPVTLETTQGSKLLCPVCGNTFYSRGVRDRHLDDVHSDPQICPHSKCNAKLKGKRKLKYHLSVHHKAAPPN